MASERRPLSQEVIDELYEEATLDLKYSNPQSPCQGNQADCASAVLGLIATVAALREENETLQRGLLLDALQKLGPAETEAEPMNEYELLADAIKMADKAKAKFGPHPSADFAACRVAEEAGELVAAATSMTNGRPENRTQRIREEAIDTIAMVIRLMREFPNGR